jgi:hypothetical protein
MRPSSAGSPDMVTLLVRWRQTPSQAVTDAISRLGDAGIRTSGVVLSNVDLTAQIPDNLRDQRIYLAAYRAFYSSISPLTQTLACWFWVLIGVGLGTVAVLIEVLPTIRASILLARPL